MARYAPTMVPTTDIANMQRWLREETEGIRRSTDDIYELANFSVSQFTVAGYGGIFQSAASVPIPDISSGFADITTMDTSVVPPKGMQVNTGASSITVGSAGVWYVSTRVALEHNELNAGRVMALRLFNKTTGQPGANVFRYGVARNVAVTNISLGAYVEVVNAGDEYTLQLGSDGDVFSGVSSIDAIFELHSVSQYKGDFQLDAKQKRTY